MGLSVIDMERQLTAQQMGEVLSPDNWYFAGLALNRPPTYEDALRHFYKHCLRPHPTIIEFVVEEETAELQPQAA